MDVREIWGVLSPDVLRKIVVVSPHFDDAAMGAGHLLLSYPGSTVITVLAGEPPSYPDEVSPWDAAGGFVHGDDVVAARRKEDLAAMTELDADHVWLEFPDHQYLPVDERPTAEEIAPDLRTAIAASGASAVFLPMGIANPDHVVTHDAGMLVRSSFGDDVAAPTWFCYEDHGYKHLPGMLAWRVSKLFRSGIWPTPAIVPVELDVARKAKAIMLYTSQIPPLEQDHMLRERMEGNVPEQYWRLATPPAGWDTYFDMA
jgi:LmbE family N-acetylglucosaminyl deacetylase